MSFALDSPPKRLTDSPEGTELIHLLRMKRSVEGRKNLFEKQFTEYSIMGQSQLDWAQERARVRSEYYRKKYVEALSVLHRIETRLAELSRFQQRKEEPQNGMVS